MTAWNSVAEPANTITTKALMMVGCASILTANIARIGRNTKIPVLNGKGVNDMVNEEIRKAIMSTFGSGDPVNHPSHYETGKFECIDVMCEAIGLEDTKGFCLCNAFKYIYRCTKKHETPVEDVKKAIWYLKKFLELEGEKRD